MIVVVVTVVVTVVAAVVVVVVDGCLLGRTPKFRVRVFSAVNASGVIVLPSLQML